MNYRQQRNDCRYRKFIFLPRIQRLAGKFYPESTPPLSELEHKTDLMFVNSNEVIDGPESFYSNVVRVGGLQISKARILSSEINDFIVSGKKGSILFSMGTNFRSEMLTRDKKKMFLDAIRELKDYNFVWKFDEEKLCEFEKPANLMVKAWIPQNDVLAHEKIIAFISHCGLLSTHEAYFNAVPMIGVPIYTDQARNCERARQNGVAEVLNLKNLSKNLIVETVKAIAGDSKYLLAIQEKSKLFKSQKEAPMER